MERVDEVTSSTAEVYLSFLDDPSGVPLQAAVGARYCRRYFRFSHRLRPNAVDRVL
jgi:hypothetical protein